MKTELPKDIKYNIKYYPYKEEKQYECWISYKGYAYKDMMRPALGNTKDEAMEIALGYFKQEYFIMEENYED